MRVIPNSAFFENAEQLLSEGNNVELRCFGRSMHPYLQGDGREVIVASPFSSEELIPGVIALYRYNGRHICHRIIRRDGELLLIQGDGVINKQEEVSTADVIGIIRTVIRRNNKPVSTQSKFSQCYWNCWRRLTPVRKYLLFAYRVMNKMNNLLNL